jgi:hypothetical protein
MVAGGADDLWPSCDFAQRAMATLTASGHAATYQDESVCVPGAGHAVSGVGLPAADSMWAVIGTDAYSLGGTAEANGHAARQLHLKEKAFLERVAK